MYAVSAGEQSALGCVHGLKRRRAMALDLVCEGRHLGDELGHPAGIDRIPHTATLESPRRRIQVAAGGAGQTDAARRASQPVRTISSTE